MPELPEVETSRLGISPHIIGCHIRAVQVRESRLRWPIPADLAQHIEGAQISQILRRGKYLILSCQHAKKYSYVLIHLGMSGNLRIIDHNTPAAKHDHVDFLFDNNLCLRYHDPRRFGCILLSDDWQQHRLIKKLGIEPLEQGFDGAYLHQRAQGKKQAIKNFIMDSHQVVGVGNIYASESLFMAGIHPNSPAGKVSLAAYQRLALAVIDVLQAAIKQGGTSLKDFRQSDGKPGYFKQALQVYGRKDAPCLQCQSPIEQLKIGQRASYFCPYCQVRD